MTTKTPKATLRILRRPDLAPGAARFDVDCRYSTTGLTSAPTPALSMTDDMLIFTAAYAHEERCGPCDVSDVLDRGDQQMRALTEELWPRIQGALLMRGRRN